ncbi:MAG TPA: lytic transglycosylase domain-containing protein [Vicinamibacterales bacterium]|nr:lytic transglycosylase domain-containing protein [Vicinamibacterales bacterium]
MNRPPAMAAAALVAVAFAAGVPLPAQQDAAHQRNDAGAAAAPGLAPTARPPVPTDLNALWYAPAPNPAPSPALADLVKGLGLLEEGDNAAAALPLLTRAAKSSMALADYARYFTARALMKLDRPEDAEAAFAAVAASAAEGHLPEDAALGQAEAREARQDYAGAMAVYTALLQRKLAAPYLALARLGAAAERGGQFDRAVAAYRRVYYEYPLTTESADAEAALTRLNAWNEDDEDVPLELARADALFRARRWPEARASYERASGGATGADRDRAHLRTAACDVYLTRYRQARDPLKGQLSGPFADEANFFYVTALRGLGDQDEYVRQARIFADGHRDSPFAEEMLNNLASHFIIVDEDARADEVFRVMMDRYPAGRFTERAYWRSGWWAYRAGRPAEAATLFDRGAAMFPRSDYRPSWLYWSGRAWRQAGERALGDERLTLAATDYFNTYYGRLARGQLGARSTAVNAPFARQATPASPFPTSERVGQLMVAGLHREALNELQYAQRMWGDSPPLTATIALVQNRLGNLRLGINAMKRAYPQWMAAGGEQLPVEIQRVVFPLDFWPLLQKHAAAQGLDPYLVAALVAQESTFDPVIRSSANAVGLMQVLPSTGRQFARRLQLRRFTPARLTDPETNVRLGTTIFAESLRKFGGVHYALAAYNAGDERVAAWRRERPDLPQDEFIDDIPFPETQNYVKRILGTAEDYRRLYGK